MFRKKELKEQEKFSELLKENVKKATLRAKEKEELRKKEISEASQRLALQIAEQRDSRQRETELKKLVSKISIIAVISGRSLNYHVT